MKKKNLCTFVNKQEHDITVTGDPTNTGNGGTTIDHLIDESKPSVLRDEITQNSQKHTSKGLVATANPGPDLNNSQFYITLSDKELLYLDNKHTIFGQVAEGLDVVDKLNKIYCDKAGKPLIPVYIKHTYVLDDVFPDPEGMIVPPESPKDIPKELQLDLDVEQKIANKSEEEIKKETEVHLAKKRAEVLVMVDDLPDADIKPPENALFVCKLNPVTQEDDLELIFSRYGPITSCNIVRDRQTGDSLQYAFIEYNKKEDCENAYFRMQNALIDGRRVHVDFSQSVMKQWAGFKRKQLADIAKNMANEELENKDKREEPDDGNVKRSDSRKESHGKSHHHKHSRTKSKDRTRNRSRSRSGDKRKAKHRSRSRSRSKDKRKHRHHH